MKKSILFFLTLLMLFSSCSDEVLYDTSIAKNAPNATFSFNPIISQGSWRYYSIQQKFDACQIPDSIISTLSTDQLVELCASHPLNSLCYAYDNPMIGALYVMHHFNGFKELQKRSDASEKLINFYENVDFSAITSNPYPMTLTCNNKLYSSSNIAFIEFVLASGEIPSVFNNDSKKLDDVSYRKYEDKLSNFSIYGINNLNNSLMIQSKIALRLNKFSSNDEKKTIEDFYYNCGQGSDINKVSKILFNQN